MPWLLLLFACAPKHLAPWLADVRVVGPDPSGRGVRFDPDLPSRRPDRVDTPAAARETAWDAEQLAFTPHARWWPGLSILRREPPRPPIDLPSLHADADRVATWFVDAGWSSAEVDVVIEPETVWWSAPADRWRTASLRVTPGVRDVVARVTLTGASPLSASARAAVIHAMPRPGEVTSAAIRAHAAAAIRRALSHHGEPLADVALLPTARGDGATDLEVRLHVRGGATMGDVRVAGTTSLSPERVAAAIHRFAPPDQPWRGAVLDAATLALRDQAVVTGVEVDEVAEGHRVALQLRVSELPARGFKAGITTWGPSSLLSAGVEMKWHARVGDLATLRGRSLLSWRLFDGPADALVRKAQTGPGVHNDLELAVPLGPLSRVDFVVANRLRLESWRGYSTASAIGEVGIAARPTARFTLGAAFRGGWFSHFAFPLQLSAWERSFGPNGTFANAYDVLAPVLWARYDTRDRERLPQRGVLLVGEAIPWASSLGQPWHRLHVDLRWYANISPGRFTLVARAAAGVHIIDDADDRRSLISNRFLLGGIDGPRGFGTGRLGTPGSAVPLDGVLTGGDAMLMASVEGQWTLHPDVVATAFVDVGRVWESGLDWVIDGQLRQRGVHFEDLQPTAGVGLVVRTPLGGLAGWVGVRLREDTDLTTDLPRILIHATLAPEF
jgi:hypothetical protein